MKTHWLLVPAIMILVGCQGYEGVDERPLGLGFDPANMDTTIRPQDDFYRYVNGTWLETVEIPEDRASISSFEVVRDSAQSQLRRIIEDAASAESRPMGSDQQKVGDLYLSYMDTARIESLGLTPIQEELDRIESIASVEDLVRTFGEIEVRSILDPISMWVSQDARNTSQYILHFAQSGIALPDRDYYFDDRFEELRTKYLTHITRMHELAGIPDAAAKARTIYDVEARLAESHWTRTQVRDREARYNKFSVSDAQLLTPNLNWDIYLEALRVESADSLIIWQPDYLEVLNAALAEVSLEDWKTYLRFHVLSDAAPQLSSEFVEEDFDFFGRTVNGQPEMRPRWRRAVSATNGALGEMVGKLYVERHFPEEAKVRMAEYMANLKEAFAASIDELDWMTDATKQEALDKLSKFGMKIGYPDKWRDYSSLDIHPEDAYGNVRRARAFEHMRQMNKLGGPIDRDEWVIPPQTVNAGYLPSMNEVIFPAAILQPPFFFLDADDAVNYGAIVAGIGHEFSHGFDDQGRKSDGDGNLRDWWTEEDAEEYKRRAEGLIEQYNAYTPIEGSSVNGELTLGENIGDLAGLTLAYKAYKISLEGQETPVIDGFTGDERFYIGWAQLWRAKYRDEHA
jgi:predicted metalloendopeptidase